MHLGGIIPTLECLQASTIDRLLHREEIVWEVSGASLPEFNSKQSMADPQGV